jgi:hypothetical protein
VITAQHTTFSPDCSCEGTTIHLQHHAAQSTHHSMSYTAQYINTSVLYLETVRRSHIQTRHDPHTNSGVHVQIRHHWLRSGLGGFLGPCAGLLCCGVGADSGGGRAVCHSVGACVAVFVVWMVYVAAGLDCLDKRLHLCQPGERAGQPSGVLRNDVKRSILLPIYICRRKHGIQSIATKHKRRQGCKIIIRPKA